MTTPHPADTDTAKPGDAFRDEDGVTWMLTDGCIPAWSTSRPVGGYREHYHSEARRERTLTPLVPTLTPEGVNPIEEWKAAAEFQISRSSVQDIKHGRSWGWLQ